MNELINNVLSQWGIVGLVGLAAGWIIYDNFKSNKEREKYIEEKILSNNSQYDINSSLLVLQEKLDKIESNNQLFRQDINKRISEIENKLSHTEEDSESHKLEMIIKVAPSIHGLLETSIDDIKADHMYVALFHNGVSSIGGIPFMKFDIICEKYFPIKNESDIELSTTYKNEDLVAHNQLFPVLFQNKYVKFDINEKGRLQTIDSNLYHRLLSRGVKEVMFGIFKDKKGIPNGFICAYSFESGMDEESFSDSLITLSTIYKNIMDL